MTEKTEPLVYSTDHGRMCPQCAKPIKACSCQAEKPPKGDGIVRLALETKGRKGKGVTVVLGVPLASKALKALGKELKQKCGTGGTVKNGVIELQGDKRDILEKELSARGWQVKRVRG
ncbi:translation initiation factor Sui1 [Oligoflexia bacterium]|nr:translation initiation factor Sui1 [Oligoflexia bacterium]